MTNNFTNPVAVVADFNDQVVLSQIPDRSFSAGAGRGQDVLHLFVPRNTADVLQGLEETPKSKLDKVEGGCLLCLDKRVHPMSL